MSYIENKQIIYINSKNKREGTHSNFSYEINIKEKVDHAVVLACDIPKSFYLISSSNNSFYLDENGTETLITISEGNYTLRQWLTALSNALTTGSSHSWTYAVSYNTSRGTGKLLYTATTAATTHTIKIRCYDGLMYEALGFSKDTTNTLTNNMDNTYSISSSNVIRLYSESSIFLRSNLIQNSEDNVLQEIYASNALDFSNISFQNQCPLEYAKPIAFSSRNEYNFFITDEDGQILETNGVNVLITILLFKKSNINEFVKQFLKLQLLN